MTTSRADKLKRTFQVWGLVWVPVSVQMDVEAPNADAAMKKAKRVFVADKRRYIKEGTEDYGAAHKFEPLNAEPL